MSPLGKIVTTGIALVTGTSLLTGVTTAYMLRPAAPADTMTATYAPTPVRRAPAVVAPRVTPVASHATVYTPRPTPVATTASDCATGGDRAWRIAKPGALGGLLGAGLGAAGGAIANGGSGAGKGALIGGLVGAVAGTGYGAYKTKNECGTIFGNPGFAERGAAPGSADRGPVTEAALRPRAADDITIYNVR
ncbi:MAG TPA: hypothetical protein VGT00_03085 [Methylomirabilota bacterium]|jgi:hypothetical protein|nr:hypothetical protein [Methylomirabilota bacterium]